MGRMDRIVKKHIALILALAAALSALGVRAETKGSGVGMNISDFTSVGLDGEPVDGSVFGNATVTVVNLWQRWCGPCMIELPHFLALHEHYSATPEADVQVFGALYYEQSYEVQDAVDFIAQNGYYWNHMLICDELIEVALAAGDGLLHIPQTLIVDGTGTVRAQVVGKVDSEAELFALVSEWLQILSEEDFIPGDVDGSGTVTSADAILALRHAMGIALLADEQTERGDIDGNGSVGVSDAVGILRRAMGLQLIE